MTTKLVCKTCNKEMELKGPELDFTALPDLSGLEGKVADVAETLKAIRESPTPKVDLSPVQAEMQKIAAGLAALQPPQGHPSPESAFKAWEDCPDCKKTMDGILDTMLTSRQQKTTTPNDIIPAAEPVPIPKIELVATPTTKVVRRGFDNRGEVPGTGFLRKAFGLNTVQEDRKYYVQAQDEQAAKEAAGSGLVPAGCAFKCDDKGCYWLCEE